MKKRKLFPPFPIATFVLFAMVAFIGCSPEEVLETNGPTELACTIDSDQILKNDPNAAVDYIVNCLVSINAELTIEAGTVIEFASETGMVLTENLDAILISEGTSANPVILRGLTDDVGLWKGLDIQGTHVRNELLNTHISNAGSSSFNGEDVQSSIKVYTGKIKIRNCVIEKSGGVGIYVHSWSEEDAIDGFASNTIRTCEKYPIEMSVYHVSSLDQNSIFQGNTINKISILPGGSLVGDHTWVNPGIPLLVDNNVYVGHAADAASLTIKEGTELQFRNDKSLRVTATGYLNVQGTASNPVKMIGETSAAGAWKGIYVLSNDVRNSIDHTILSHGGSSPHDGSSIKTLVRLGNVGTCCSNAKLSISNSTLSHSDCLFSLYYDEVSLTALNVTKESFLTEYCE